MISNLIVGPQCEEEEEEEACPTCNAIKIINVSSLVTIIIIASFFSIPGFLFDI